MFYAELLPRTSSITIQIQNTSDLSSFLLPTSSINFHFDFDFILSSDPDNAHNSDDAHGVRITDLNLPSRRARATQIANKGTKDVILQLMLESLCF